MKDIVTPVPPEEVRYVIKKCLENAALVNYTRISEFAKIEGIFITYIQQIDERISNKQTTTFLQNKVLCQKTDTY